MIISCSLRRTTQKHRPKRCVMAMVRGCAWTAILLAGFSGVGCDQVQQDAEQPVRSVKRRTTESPWGLMVTDPVGQERTISEFSEGQNLVVVVTRGFVGDICPFCLGQVQSLAREYNRIKEAGGHVLVIFPVDSQDYEGGGRSPHRTELVARTKSNLSDAATKLPFHIVSDIQHKVVEELGLSDVVSSAEDNPSDRKPPAKPATYILNKRGGVTYLHIGQDPADRPKIETIIEQLEALRDQASSE